MKKNQIGGPAGLLLLALVAITAASCSKSDAEGGGRSGPPAARGGAGRMGGGPGGPGGFGQPAAAVPVEAATVERRDISFFIESNGTLEAENDVEIVSRTTGPVVELAVEEGDAVRRGDLLARIDEAELRAQVEISRVALKEARQAYDRALKLQEDALISPEDFEAARTRFETAKAQLDGSEIQLRYTRVTAPFGGLVIERHVQFAQQVTPGSTMFRLSDFEPLLCPIQVPERELGRLRVGQPGYLTVEAWPDERFAAKVQRIRPVVEAATGTVKVTLEVDAKDKLRPGMFARVFLQAETHENVLVIPKSALSLESIGDTVFVVGDGRAERREVTLGFAEGDRVEVAAGLSDGERVVTIGQDGLSDGTPIQVLGGTGADKPPATAGAPEAGGPAGGGPTPGGGLPGFDPSQLTPERLEMIKQRMRERGLTDEQIEERLKRMREAAKSN